MTIPKWRRDELRRRHAEAEFKRNALGTVMGFEGADPQEIAEAHAALVMAVIGRGDHRFCLDCIEHAGPNTLLVELEPELPCSHCHRPLGNADARTRARRKA